MAEAEEPTTFERDLEAAEAGLVTHDGKPVDGWIAEKQMRLLTEALYSSWGGPPPGPDGRPRTFVAMANVGLFIVPKNPAVVPDVLLSVDVLPPVGAAHLKRNQSYFLWRRGKLPDVVIEIVSDRRGDELGKKMRKYERIGISYYVVHDPEGVLGMEVVQGFRLERDEQGSRYVPMARLLFPELELGLVLQDSQYEDVHRQWLRWCDARGVVLPTGGERAEAEKQRAEAEKQRAEAEKQRAEAEKQRAEAAEAQVRALVAKLIARGIDPAIE